MINESGEWQAYRKGDKVYIATISDYDTVMEITAGEFNTIDEKYEYAQEMAYRLNVYNATHNINRLQYE